MDIRYLEYDDIAPNSTFSATRNGLSVIFTQTVGNRTRLVECANLQPVIADEYWEFTVVESTRRRITSLCVQITNSDYFDEGTDIFTFRLREIGQLDTNETGYFSVTVGTSISDTPLSTTILESAVDARVNLTWVDAFGSSSNDDFNVTLNVSWVVPLTNRMLSITPPQDFFNVRPDGTSTVSRTGQSFTRPAPLVVGYTLFLEGLALFQSSFMLRVRNVFSPLRTAPIFGIPLGQMNVTRGALNDLPGPLLIITDPDEDEFDVGVSVISSSSLIYFIFPDLSRPEQRNPLLKFGTCEFDWQFRGCSDFTLAGPASLVNAVLAKAKATSALSTTRGKNEVRVEVFKPSPAGIPSNEATGGFAFTLDPDYTYTATLDILETGGTTGTGSSEDSFLTLLRIFIVGVAMVLFVLMLLCLPLIILYACAVSFVKAFPGLTFRLIKGLAWLLYRILTFLCVCFLNESRWCCGRLAKKLKEKATEERLPLLGDRRPRSLSTASTATAQSTDSLAMPQATYGSALKRTAARKPTFKPFAS
jgi:hypothetical protein